jgi:hypothetical protein
MDQGRGLSWYSTSMEDITKRKWKSNKALDYEVEVEVEVEAEKRKKRRKTAEN